MDESPDNESAFVLDLVALNSGSKAPPKNRGSTAIRVEDARLLKEHIWANKNDEKSESEGTSAASRDSSSVVPELCIFFTSRLIKYYVNF